MRAESLSLVASGIRSRRVTIVCSNALAPDVVVSGHRQRRVAHLGLARELGLGNRRHTDDVNAPLSVNARLRLGGELRPLDAHVSPAPVDLRPNGLARLVENGA